MEKKTKTEKNSKGPDSAAVKLKKRKKYEGNRSILIPAGGIWRYPEYSYPVGVFRQTKSIIYVDSRVYTVSSYNIFGVEGLY